MAQEEFQESDIIFQDNVSNSYEDANSSTICVGVCSNYKKSRNDDEYFKRKKESVPINIPQVHFDNGLGYHNYDIDYDDDDSNDGAITPPHVILGRRIVRKMAFSVSIGNGRALKGRQLNEIRDSILRLTGFIDLV